METIHDALKKHPFLTGFSDDIIEKLIPISEHKNFSENEIIFRQGTNAYNFYLVDTGLLSVGFDPKLHSPVNIQQITDGEVLGWSWLIPPYHWQFDAKAVEESKTIMLDAVKLRQMFEFQHEIGYNFSRRILQIVSKRLSATRIQFWDIYKMHYLLEHNNL